jgi:hypothetical protein
MVYVRYPRDTRSSSSCAQTGNIVSDSVLWPETNLENSPTEPWHGRHLVALPTSHQLGLENFTVSPTTPPVRFRPVKVANGNYALQGEGEGTDSTGFPYLAALKSTIGTRTTSMALIYAQNPTLHPSSVDVGTCPEGYECVIDQWTFDDAGPDIVYPNFRFAGYQGRWKPMKDAKTEGWHVYWKANAGLYHPIQLDLVSMDGDDD